MCKEDKVVEYCLFLDLEGNYYKDGLKDGKSDGEGEMIVKDKYKYIGTFSDDYPNGKGILANFENGTFPYFYPLLKQNFFFFLKYQMYSQQFIL